MASRASAQWVRAGPGPPLPEAAREFIRAKVCKRCASVRHAPRAQVSGRGTAGCAVGHEHRNYRRM